MGIFENFDEEEMAVQLLKEFNEKTAQLGRLLMNLDKNLTHDEWKLQCDVAKKEIDTVINKIRKIGLS